MAKEITTNTTRTWPGFLNKDAARNGGWSQEDIEALQKAPRTKDASIETNGRGRSRFVWPEVDGVTLCPFGSSLTLEEKALYKEYRARLKTEKPEAQGTRPQGFKKVDPAVMAKWQAMLDAVGDNEEARSIIMDLMPKAKDNLLFQLTGVNSLAEIKDKVSYHYMMFRGPNGEFADHTDLKTEELGPLFVQGWMPAFTKGEVDEKLEKLSARGVDLKSLVA